MYLSSAHLFTYLAPVRFDRRRSILISELQPKILQECSLNKDKSPHSFTKRTSSRNPRRKRAAQNPTNTVKRRRRKTHDIRNQASNGRGRTFEKRENDDTAIAIIDMSGYVVGGRCGGASVAALLLIGAALWLGVCVDGISADGNIGCLFFDELCTGQEWCYDGKRVV